jgi:hypothetical protein
MTTKSLEELLGLPEIPEPPAPITCVRSPEAEDLIVAALSRGYQVKDAAALAGVSRVALHYWRRNSQGFAQRCDAAIREARRARLDKARRAFIDAHQPSDL